MHLLLRSLVIIVILSLLLPTGTVYAAGESQDAMSASTIPEDVTPEAVQELPSDFIPLTLGIPVACEIGKECFIQNYVDTDSGPGYRDYMCGILSYDDHKGTAFRPPSMVEMRSGIDVLAAADGAVKALRDGMDDIDARRIDPKLIRNRECGNGVVLSHTNGWETLYCHLKKGSVVVRRGDVVKKGQKIGQLGHSGSTTFPALFFAVRYNGLELDPFVPEGDKSCQFTEYYPLKSSLWEKEALEKLKYQPTALLKMGFATARPEAEDVREGKHTQTTFDTHAPALITWVDLMGVLPGDKLIIELVSPGGGILKDDIQVVEKPQAQLFYFSGLLRDEYGWRPGDYTAHFKLMRYQGDSLSTVIQESRTLTLLDAGAGEKASDTSSEEKGVTFTVEPDLGVKKPADTEKNTP